jgi:hypothetical protein
MSLTRETVTLTYKIKVRTALCLEITGHQCIPLRPYQPLANKPATPFTALPSPQTCAHRPSPVAAISRG